MLSTVLAKNNIRLACHINSPAISWHRAHICSCQLQSFLPFLPKASLLFYIGEIYLTQVHSVKKTAPKASERRRTNCKQRSHAKKNCIQIRLQFFAQIHLEEKSSQSSSSGCSASFFPLPSLLKSSLSPLVFSALSQMNILFYSHWLRVTHCA